MRTHNGISGVRAAPYHAHFCEARIPKQEHSGRALSHLEKRTARWVQRILGTAGATAMLFATVSQVEVVPLGCVLNAFPCVTPMISAHCDLCTMLQDVTQYPT